MPETNENEAPEAALELQRLRAILESLLFAAGEPVSLAQLANALETVPRDEIRRALGEMANSYASGRGLLLEEIAGGYQLRTPREHAPYIRRLLAARPPRLSRALLETLAIVAYRQPVTRPEIELLRGVDSGGVLDTLLARGLIKLAGRKDAPGRPLMYTSTPEFLELFGLKDLESLPDLEEFRALEGLHDPAAESRAAEAGENAPTEEKLPGGSPRAQTAERESPHRLPEITGETSGSGRAQPLAGQAPEPLDEQRGPASEREPQD